MIKLDEAKKELSEKTYLQIQEETAWKWASRAAAAYSEVSNQSTLMQKVGLLNVAEEYKHEAVEHAALYEDGGKLVASIQGALDSYADDAAKHVEKELQDE